MVITFKAKFLAHILNLKYKGEKITLMCRLTRWIQENINFLYERQSNRLQRMSLVRFQKKKGYELKRQMARESLRKLEYFNDHFEKSEI